MKTIIGQFVFIKDEFLDKYFPPIKTAGGKIHNINHGKGRPFFYVFDETEDLAWVVPVSSDKSGKKHEKYNEYLNKATKEKPNWIALGKVDDVDSVFNLSGMFPVPKNMIDHIYYSKRYKFYPISKIEGAKIITLAKKYKAQNEINTEYNLDEIIKSPYKEILKDYYKSKDKNHQKEFASKNDLEL